MGKGADRTACGKARLGRSGSAVEAYQVCVTPRWTESESPGADCQPGPANWADAPAMPVRILILGPAPARAHRRVAQHHR